jgi:hypothetical protein
VDEARGGHRHGCAFGFGQREPQILDGEPRSHSRRAVVSIDNLSAVSLMYSGIEQRTGEDIEREMAIDAAFSQQRQHLAQARARRLQVRRRREARSPLHHRRQGAAWASVSAAIHFGSWS